MFKASMNFDKDDFRKSLQKAAEEAAEQEIRKQLSVLRCPDHGQIPTLQRTGRNAEGPQFDIAACCEPMMDKARKVVAGN